ncbi:MAG: hypothetical protein JSS54_03255 [Proteobacteria bacterium]|nr:hypothetical protein [Pseudomonadota bacterium]
MTFQVGEWIEIRSKEEILATLDKTGRLEGMPFMPEMFQFCGQKFKVYKSAHKTCEFVYTLKSRSVPNTVHLDLRCDGAYHGGCQHACLLYWKKAWLKDPYALSDDRDGQPVASGDDCTEADVLATAQSTNERNETIYSCQGTDIPRFSSPLAWWDMRQYLRDYRTGNVDLQTLFNGMAFGTFTGLVGASNRLGLKLGGPLRWLYDQFAFVCGPFPRRPGKVPKGHPLPWSVENLQAGELVRVKSYDEILKTIDVDCRNRGLSFDAEMVPYCGKEFRVRAVIDTMIDEKTGKITKLKNRCVSLEGAICRSKYSNCRINCPRSILPWWREIWLERVSEDRRAGSHS